MVLQLDVPRIQTLEETYALIGRLANAFGFDQDSCDDICLAVHEAVANAIQHGDAGEGARHAALRLVLHQDRLEIRIRDQGRGFDPRIIPNPIMAENLFKPSGRGIHLMRALMDEVTFRRLTCGMEVTMMKRLPAGTRATASSQTSDSVGCDVQMIGA